MHELIIVVAKYFILISLLGVLYVFVRLSKDGKKQFILHGIIGAIIAVVLAKIANHLYYDPRPFVAGHFTPYFAHGNDNGFPSDHTLLSSFLGFLVLSYRKNWGYLLLAIAALIGAARVIAGVHHVADIIGAFVFSGIGVLVAGLIIDKVVDKKSAKTISKQKNES